MPGECQQVLQLSGRAVLGRSASGLAVERLDIGPSEYSVECFTKEISPRRDWLPFAYRTRFTR